VALIPSSDPYLIEKGPLQVSRKNSGLSSGLENNGLKNLPDPLGPLYN